ncbi:ImmA/IrrE family metallo-endopeptidase [Amycolatopsis taiwanensis]|uniref:ImmA/IrrE family metallo-endopeptidase n=1 Tax=Amycolatopsis taiwanensis TaxID=342230 RepID=UPI0004BAB722|nr:ImmA/IrrE family metallo-endopeptidase [Amycolatopsis taiwanensis]
MIATWRQAHRVAQLAAVHARADLDVPPDSYVDVVAAIRRADIPLMFQDMPGHFGTYISPATHGPGILVNSGLSMPTLRHTAAHELGHHQLRHGDSVDLGLDLWESQTPGAWTGTEMSAEAFAAWFLMPRPAVLRGLRLLGKDKPRSARDAYRLAALLGASFRGMCRHLANLELVSATTASTWARAGRARVRASLAGPYAPVSGGEVHVLDTGMRDATVHAAAGDLLIATPTVHAELKALGGDSAGWEQVELDDPAEGQLDLLDEPRIACWQVTAEFTAPARLGSGSAAGGWSVLVEPVSVRDGIDLAWLERHQNDGPNTLEEQTK